MLSAGWLRPSSLVLIMLVAITLVVRLLPAWFLQAENGDIQLYRRMAQTILRGDTLYPPVVLFPYSPFSQLVPAGMLELARVTGWRFDFTIKLPCILVDALGTVVIWQYLRWRGASVWSAAAWTLGWVLNPVSIITSAFHGNLMAAVPTFVFAAFALADRAYTAVERRGLLVAAALMLGIGIATRHYAVPLLPIFLLFGTRNLKEAVAFVALALAPAALSALPYLLLQRETLLLGLFAYSGHTDFGWIAAVRSIPYFVSGNKLHHFDEQVIEGTKRLFILAVVSLLPLVALFDRRRLRAAFFLPPLLFYALYAGVSAQYFVWVLPFAIGLRQRLIMPYTLLATTAMVCFFAVYHPDLIFGAFGRLLEESPTVITTFVAADLGIVLLSVGWCAWIVVDGLRHRAPNALVQSTLDLFRLPARVIVGLLPWASVVGFVAWTISAIQIGARTIEVVRSFLR